MKASLQLIAQTKAIQGMFDAAEKLPTDFYPVEVPDGVVGAWGVRTVTVSADEAAFNNMRHVLRGHPEFVVSPGSYKVLSGPMGVMMSNTQLEYRTNKEFIGAASGDILIFGLGLGMVLGPLHEKSEVNSITVIELEPDVIELVLPTYLHMEKLKVEQGDAFKFKPSRKYDHIFHDIWPDAGASNLESMQSLEARYNHWAEKQWCWSKDICVRMDRG